MEEYRLTPDELIAKDFRMIQSSRRGHFPQGKSDWIAAIKKVYERDRISPQNIYERNFHIFIPKTAIG